MKDGAIYVINVQDNASDMADDIVHEIAHAVEENIRSLFMVMVDYRMSF